MKNKIVVFLLGALFIATILVWLAVFWARADGLVKVDFVDVGQGDAVFIEAPNQNQVLVDGGPSDAILAKLGRLLPFYDKKIDLLVLSHPDADHLNGLIEVLKKYDVGQILETGINDDTANYRTWQALIKEKNIPVVFARAGQVVQIADNLALKIIYPLGNIAGQDYTGKTNNSSLVAKLTYGQNKILLTGDAEKQTEAILLFSGADLSADILQVAHHGSKNSTSPEFVSAVAPKQAVIQVGADNRYGHPTQEVLDILKNVKIWRNDLDGDVEFSCGLKSCVKN